MDNRSTGIVATLAAVVLCGLPGLISLCCGAIFALAGAFPDTTYSGGMTPKMAVGLGIGGVIIGVLFIAITVGVGYFTLRRKPELATSFPDEPIPPAI
jgi:hypothetical protein